MRLIFSAAIALVSFQAASGQAFLILVGTIQLPGVEGRIDHLAFDAGAQRLYVADYAGTVTVLSVTPRTSALDTEFIPMEIMAARASRTGAGGGLTRSYGSCDGVFPG